MARVKQSVASSPPRRYLNVVTRGFGKYHAIRKQIQKCLRPISSKRDRAGLLRQIYLDACDDAQVSPAPFYPRSMRHED